MVTGAWCQEEGNHPPHFIAYTAADNTTKFYDMCDLQLMEDRPIGKHQQFAYLLFTKLPYFGVFFRYNWVSLH